MKLREIEELLVKHLQESGEIRSDLAWLKRAFWIIATAVATENITRLASRLWH